MEAVQLDVNVLELFSRLFSDVKNKIKVNTAVQDELNKAVGNVPIQVLLADDDDDDFELFSEALNTVVSNVQISRAKDGLDLFEVLKEIKTGLPALIFLDLNMPCKNGFECLQILKQSKKWKAIPVLIYSTSANIDEIELTYKNGANGYIQKPNTFGDIKSLIKKVFSLNFQDLALEPSRDNYFLTA
jgi:CheY-like chemotaxis protein